MKLVRKQVFLNVNELKLIKIMSKNKIQFIYCLCNKIINTWIEDFVDEDNGEVVSITRNEYDLIQYINIIEVPISKSKLDERDIKDLCALNIKINYKNIRFNNIISKRKYTSIINKIKDANINKKSYKYKLLW